MRTKLLKIINKDLKHHSLNSLAQEIGVKQPTLYRLVKGIYKGRMDTWEKIDKYYRR